MQEQLRVVDLFCGCGGFSLGAHAAGLAPTIAFDVDPILTSSFARNFPTTRLVLTDLSTAKGRDIQRAAGGPVDGVFGGPPCQGFSEIGRRLSTDPRRSLLGHFFRLVAELRPSFFLMENVRGLAFRGAKKVLSDALNLLPGNYVVLDPMILDAAQFGAATRRPRLFVLGYDPARCDAIIEKHIRAGQARPATVKAAIGDLMSAVRVENADGFDRWIIKHPGPPSHYAAKLRAPDKTFTGHLRTAHSRAVIARFKRVEPGAIDRVGRHPRLCWDSQCPTLRAGTGDDLGSYQSVRPIHPSEPRVITVREAARLQGFPDEFVFHPTIWHSFRMIGNSVPPGVSMAIFSLLAKRVGAVSNLVPAE